MTPPNNGNKKDILKSVPVTINKVPPLLAKFKKEINTISKYFKKPTVDKSAHGTNVNSGKSYAQALKTSASTSEVLKIKETFPSLNTLKINQVNNIVNSSTNPKPCIRMTTKDPSKKQVIIPMGGDNVISFMKNSSLYIANLNRALRNSKSEVLVNYIQSENSGIMVITNKVAL